MSLSIIQAAKDKNLFRPYLQGSGENLRSWHNWLTCLRVIYGLPVRKPEDLALIRQCTGRDPSQLDPNGYNTVLLLVGRRGGKSKVSGLIGGYEALFSGKEKLLSPGEIPCVTITSPTRDQSSIIKSYLRAALGSPLLDETVVDEAKKRPSFELDNGVNVRVLTGDFRTVRGFSQLCVVVDEICFFGYTEEIKVKNDTELIRSIKPSLLTTKGRLICVSTKYAPRGWAYATHKRCFGNDSSKILVWDATSRTMNPTLSQEAIDEEIAMDPEAGKAEYLNQWREDAAIFLPREVIEAVVVLGRNELLPRSKTNYQAFCDLSGGRSDSATLAIAHKDKRKIIIDFLKEWRAPFSPYAVIGEMADDFLRHVWGDRYSAEFTAQAFRSNGISYRSSDKNKSALYLELLPRICSKEIELLDSERLITQLSSLERRCRSGGKDSIDHGPNQHDDLSNVVAGVASIASRRTIKPGVKIRYYGRGRSLRPRRRTGKSFGEAMLEKFGN